MNIFHMKISQITVHYPRVYVLWPAVHRSAFAEVLSEALCCLLNKRHRVLYITSHTTLHAVTLSTDSTIF